MARADVHFQRAAAAYNRGDDEVAEAAFTAVIAADARPATPFLFRGLSRLRRGQLDAALSDLSDALSRDPTLADAAWARGRIYADRRAWRQAASDFGRVIAALPEQARGYTARGEMCYHLGNCRQCVDDYRAAATLAPNDPKVLNRLAWVLATCPDETIRDGKSACEFARRANQLAAGNDPMILDTLAAALAERGDCAQALTVYAKIPPDQWCNDFTVHRDAFTKGQPWRDTIPNTGP